MNARTQLTFHTVPSRWRHAQQPETPHPYRRVVGIEHETGIVACKYTVAGTGSSHSYLLPERFAIGIVDFFKRHLIEEDTEDPERSMVRGRYNCHTFALEMSLGIVTTARYGKSAIERSTVNFLPSEDRLPAGKIGVISPKDTTDALHSIVGLGRDTPDCIQVLNNNSNLGISTYPEALAIYDLPESPHVIRAEHL